MTDLQRGVLALVKSAITGTRQTIPQNFDWEKALKIGKSHQMLPILYYGVTNSKIDVLPEIKEALEVATFKNVILDQNQMYYINLITEAFEKNNIDYMLLKGALLKRIYPKSELRPMSDADILIKPEQYDKISDVMQKLGFEEKYESNHELVWKKQGALIVELHKHVIPSYNKDYYAYFGDGWRLAQRMNDNVSAYRMKHEDELIYTLVHLAMHYRDAGIGIRQFIDIFIYVNNYLDLDFKYIRNELKNLQLNEFFDNVLKTVKVWFDGEKSTEKTDFITNYVFSSGSYGNYSNSILSDALKKSKSTSSKKVRSRELIYLIFMPYCDMCIKYPILKKSPILLPFMWCYRWFEAIFSKQNKIKQQSQRLKKISAENIDEFEMTLDYVGLKFDFKE